MAPPSKYSPEFRDEAVQIALRSSKTISEVARELELNSETLRGWVKKYQKQQEPAPDAGWCPAEWCSSDLRVAPGQEAAIAQLSEWRSSLKREVTRWLCPSMTYSA
ncbi:transposase [Streptomyces sp. NPDC056160]|uniref:transposase n=1 Tax=Streptomyces sp. NPDC056160 TaxID=3345731 RepID=UPI0035D64690